MESALFHGCGTALVTPFRGGRVDYDALGGLIDWQVASGIDALVVLGTTGEPSTLSASERASILECAVARNARRVPLIAGTGSNDTRTAIRQSQEAQSRGADALLVVTPYYNKTSPEGLMEHFTAIADSVELPIILYNVPGRTGLNLPPECVAQLARHPNLRAVKEASGSLRQMVDLAAACGDNVAIYCGNDDQIVPAMSLGAQGAISVASNVIPGEMHALTTSWLQGEPKQALAHQIKYLPLIRALFSEVNPIPVKAALYLLGRVEDELRLPLVPLGAEHRAELTREMARLGLTAERRP